MKNKIFLMIIETICFLMIMYIAICNLNSNTISNISISLSGKTVILSTFFVIIGVYFAGILSGFVYSVSLGMRYKNQIEFYARKTEKLSQQNEIDSDDKEALQRKIASLEIALDNALKNK